MNSGYFTFAEETEAFYTEKKSRFISSGSEVLTEDEALCFLQKQRALHKDANHHVYAYKLLTNERASDDHEPSGTAGAPILNILKAEGMMNTIIVVTRYFGGILLGTGGLTHAYGYSAKLLLKTGKVIQKVRCRNLKLTTDYVFLGKLQYFIALSDALHTNTSYTERVQLNLIIREESIKGIIDSVNDLTNGRLETSISESFFHEYPFSHLA